MTHQTGEARETGSVAGSEATPDRMNKDLAQARIHALFEAAVDCIIGINQLGLIQTVNPAAEKLFGYPSSELVGNNVKMLMPAPYQQEHDEYVARYLQTGVKRIIGIGREVVGLRKDGTVFPMDLSVAEAWSGGERIFVGIVRDITERKRSEEALRESKATLEKAYGDLQTRNDEIRSMTQQLWQAAKLAAVGELSASIAHELNNPLATITLRIESMLSKTPPEDPRRRGLEIVDQETRRMAGLVANLLQFCRRGPDEISTVDLRKELGESVELIQHHLRKRQIRIDQELAPDTPAIYANRQKLRQVFLNLLTNASDAMSQGGTLTLRASRGPMINNEPGVLLEFSDTGVGIQSADLEKVMEPFFTTKEEGKGTGLGLAICRRIIQEHNGSIRIVSEQGKGTTVRVLLPIASTVNTEALQTK
jgi:two-component system, LuxR family, sensor kinase FixL